MTTKPTFELELEAYARGNRVVAGCDEAGRGAIAGPIVAAAVVLDPANIPEGIDDSKRLSAARRATLFHEIVHSSAVGVAIADVKRVDDENVLRSSLWAMSEATRLVGKDVDLTLIDGPFPISGDVSSLAIVRGDQRSLSIAAASIIAKVMRDQLMNDLAQDFPSWGFDRHKGYGTPAHIEAIRVHGSCHHHRYSCGIVLSSILQQQRGATRKSFDRT